MLMQCFVDAGAQPGVIGLVFGVPAQVSQHLIASAMIRKVTFTGSTQVGKQLASLAGLHMKRATMAPGGHAPLLVAQDADVEVAACVSASAKFQNAGQVCIAPSRFLVHRNLVQAFLEAFGRQVQALKIGSGLAESTTLGPLAKPRRLSAMEDLVSDALKKGGKLCAGGERVGACGNFFAPTILTDFRVDSAVFNEEPFGPIAAIRAFDHTEDAITEANWLPYGLAGYAFTNSLPTLHLLADRLELGMLWVNQSALAVPEMPFGGVKDPGMAPKVALRHWSPTSTPSPCPCCRCERVQRELPRELLMCGWESPALVRSSGRIADGDVDPYIKSGDQTHATVMAGSSPPTTSGPCSPAAGASRPNDPARTRTR